MKYLLFITRRYRVSISYIVNNNVQSIIPHNNNLLDEYSSMALLIDKADIIDGSKVHTIPVKFTAVIEIPETKYRGILSNIMGAWIIFP